MWSNPQETADCDTFTKEILNGKLHFLYSEQNTIKRWYGRNHWYETDGLLNPFHAAGLILYPLETSSFMMVSGGTEIIQRQKIY